MVTDWQRKERQSHWVDISFNHSFNDSLPDTQHHISYNLRKRLLPTTGHSAFEHVPSQMRIHPKIHFLHWLNFPSLVAQRLTWESSQGHLDYRMTKRGRWDSGLSPTLPTWCVTGQSKMSGHHRGSSPGCSKRKRRSVRCYAPPCLTSRPWVRFKSGFKYKAWCR